MLRNLSSGDVVLPENFSNNIMKWGKINPDILNFGNMGANVPEIKRPNYEVNVNYGSLLTVNGDVDKQALPELKDILKQSYEYTSKQMAREARKLGYK